MQQLYGGSFTRNSFWALGKWKMNFSSKENENFLKQHHFSFQNAYFCIIWDHFNKLCHACGHKIDHLAWKPWIFTHDTSFLWTLFKIIYVLQVYYFPGNLVTYNDTMQRFPNFLILFEFFMPVSKCDQNSGHDRS